MPLPSYTISASSRKTEERGNGWEAGELGKRTTSATIFPDMSEVASNRKLSCCIDCDDEGSPMLEATYLCSIRQLR
jgi:hypothetical protein